MNPTLPLHGNFTDTSMEMEQTKSLLPSTNANGCHTHKSTNDRNNGNSSFCTSVFNLSNNVAGVGLLTLAAGKAAGGTGWVPSIAICCSLAYASSHTFILIGKACEITGEKTFKGLWSQAFGDRTAYVVDTIVCVQCFLGGTIYIGLLGDIFLALLKGASFGVDIGIDMLPPGVVSRQGVILLITSSILFPLNLIKNLSSLGFTSILGLCAVLYTTSFIVLRALDGSYSTDGKFVADGAIDTPSFDSSTMWNLDVKSLILMSNLGVAFIAHYNAPTYYRELRKASPQTFPRMVRTSYAILFAIYVITMCAGYMTFGDTAQCNILLNYHPHDMLAFLGRWATACSTLFGFPLVFNGAREGFKNAAMALDQPSVSDPKNHVKLVVVMLSCACMLAILVDDIKVIVGYSGAVLGSLLVYICPPILYANILKRYFGPESLEYKRGRRNLILVPFGTSIAVVGVIVNYRQNYGLDSSSSVEGG